MEQKFRVPPVQPSVGPPSPPISPKNPSFPELIARCIFLITKQEIPCIYRRSMEELDKWPAIP